MKIYWIKAQAPRRVLALVKHLNIEAEFIEKDMHSGELKTPEFALLNPNMKAPVLEDGDVTLWESSAIMAYLCIKAGSDMWPANNPTEQVELLRWLSWNDCHWADAVAPFYFEHIVKSTFNFGAPNEELLAASHQDFLRFAKVLDEHLADNIYIACNRLTIADFQLASMVSYWRESEMPIAAFTHILKWVDKLMDIPAWRNPWPTKTENILALRD